MLAAILVTLFCFCPTGIAAIIYADKANTLARTGNTAGAQEANNSARQFIKISIIVGIIGSVIAVAAVIAIIVIGTTATASTSSYVRDSYNRFDNQY
uniref:Interferon-induced transmembrane protein n=2 Tax=Octopus bimaculoides TaxID=37653 RepID=A0A0L8FRR2_OCTBM